MTGDVYYSEIGHQHISNIYWFWNLVVRNYDNSLGSKILDIINDKFDGEILSYRPHCDFKEEIIYLDSMKKIQWKVKGEWGNIVHEGKIIGEFKSKSMHRQSKLEDVGIFG